MNETLQEMNETFQENQNVLAGIGHALPLANLQIIISKAENGFIVRVGCKVFVFSEWVLAVEALGLYFKNPEEAIKKYCKSK